jgi:hypothetical protein
MSGQTLVPRTFIPARRSMASRYSARGLLEREALVVVVVAMWIAILVVLMPYWLVPDSWLSFVDGRLIAQRWLPHEDSLALWTLGRHWTDQQWGAHLVLYELADHGGLRAALAFGIGCVAAALIVIAVATRRLGASSRSVALGLMVPIFGAPWMAQVRSQSIALVAFALVYALLAFDARQPSRKVLWVLPLLVLWANLHGSVALGAGLAALYGLWLAHRRVHRGRGLLLVIGSPLCLLASPYGFGLIAYYRLMLIHPPLASFVTEWRPPTVEPATAVFFASAFAATALWGLHRRTLTSFEHWALPLLLVLALTAVRNAVWFELALAFAIPRLLDRMWPSRITLTPSIRRANLVLGSIVLAAVTVVCVLEFIRAPGWLDRGTPPTAAAAVAQATGTNGAVLADDWHADWLLWYQPELAGRIDYDVRFELFNTHELQQIQLLHAASLPTWRRCGSLARVVTFNGHNNEQAALREQVLAPGTRTIVDTPTFIALVQPPSSRSGRCDL